MSVTDIFQFAGTHMLTYLAPILLVFCSLAFVDQIVDSLVRLVKSARKQFNI
ncbi:MULTISPECIES: hypothetical protein [unclassified Paenibacillus]|uniref:hypothetical protein n=1 Tax=unclassified Paenibacillus TaxID=185978 RepID=UPI00040DCF19|nr:MULTISPECIES: hypothetical protein [unclassified Paenibacillus]